MKTTIIDYRTMSGELIHSVPMTGNRLWAIGQGVPILGLDYTVMRVALADGIQHVNVAKAEKHDKPTPDGAVPEFFRTIFGV